MGNNYFAIIQARLGSKRFPRKMLSRIGDYSLIEWVLKRIKKCKNLDGIILATSNLEDDINLFETAIILSFFFILRIPIMHSCNCFILKLFSLGRKNS